MDARAKTVREILHSADQYLIPFFQRFYSWKQKHWKRLRDDLTNLVEDGMNAQHFLGPLVCTPTEHVPGRVPGYQLIDGQQRMTTLTLLLAALRDVAKEHGLDELAEEIVEDYLIHKRKSGLERYKVVPRTGDREALISIVEDKVEKRFRRLGVVQAWTYFRKNIAAYAVEHGDDGLRNLFSAIVGRMSLVVITIEGENPYEIFESLNSTGLPLEESDLIRNYIFMQVSTQNQEAFHVDNWEPFETMFDETKECPAVKPTLFYRNYLMRDGAYGKAGETFLGFKEQNRERSLSPADQVTELKRFAEYELMLRRPGSCNDAHVRRMFEQIAVLDITTAHALLLNLLNRKREGELSEEGLLACLSDLSSFVVRRSICGESTRAYGRWFVEAITAINEDPPSDLRAYWLRRGWPDDDTFTARLEDFALYRRESKKCRLILEELERSFGHKEKVDASTLTIEHVMPQTIARGKSGRAWQEMLGAEWSVVHERWLHTLGNLTLTGYNSDMSNRPFCDKKTALTNSNLVLNRYFVDHETWNGDEIRRRARLLAVRVAEIWKRPSGHAYTAPKANDVVPLTNAEWKGLRLSFWTGLAELMRERSVLPYTPKPSSRGWVAVPFGRRGFRFIAFINRKPRYIGVALACVGNNAAKSFRELREQKDAIESELGNGLLWQANPHQNMHHITLRDNDANVRDTSQWSQQLKWIADLLERFFAVFDQRCGALAAARPGGAPRGRNRLTEDEFIQDFDKVGDKSREAETARQLLDSLLDDRVNLVFDFHRTPKDSSVCRVRRKSDGRRLLVFTADRRRKRCSAGISPKRTKMPDEMRVSLEGLLGFKLSPLGKGILKWCAKSQANTAALVQWIRQQSSTAARDV